MKTRVPVWLAFGVAGALVVACGAPEPRSFTHGLSTRRDSVIEMAVRLGRAVHLMDDYARSLGTLPATLDPLVARSPAVFTRDLWGRQLRYTVNGKRYELRSAGPDAEFGTSDDVISEAQLGRVLPCETRHGFGIVSFGDSAPPCDEGPVRVYFTCPALLRAWGEIDVIANDSSGVTGRMLVALGRRVDGHARMMGALPQSLRQVISNRDITDAWGEGVLYQSIAATYELRSRGADRIAGTADDVIVRERLGNNLPCAFDMGGQTLVCADPPPPCSEGEVVRRPEIPELRVSAGLEFVWVLT